MSNAEAFVDKYMETIIYGKILMFR